MNEQNLHELIDRYEANFEKINNSANDEIFKWKTVKRFRDVWFAEDAAEKPFAQMFQEARKEAAVILDNSRVSPTNGIVKMAEKFPEEVERLFREVLFADDGGNITVRQDHMEQFLEQIEIIRQKSYPGCWKYKQERHAASCYLAFFAPEDNYIYRYSEAKEFAKYIEFGKEIGSGENFQLTHYYEMCDLIVDALRQHETLLKKHFALLESDQYYRDESLHLLAFDLMYCCRCYNLYAGMEFTPRTTPSSKAYRLEQLREKEAQERAEKLEALDAQIRELELDIEQYEDISLVGVEVTQKDHGPGVIISQDLNFITVKFEKAELKFIIHRKYSVRPTFEDDTEIVDALSDLADKTARLKTLKEQRQKMQM